MLKGDSLMPSQLISGMMRGHRIVNGIWVPHTKWQQNDILFDWASIVGNLLRNAPNLKPYFIGGMYIEFENNGGAPVSIPTFDRSGGIGYYNDLLTSPNRDYLRVPLTAHTFDSTDEDLFPGGNALVFFARTEGIEGVHGKPFSDAVSSRVYGGALVSFPDFADPTQDLVFSRTYFDDTDEQLIKLAGSQLGLEWPITLK